MKYTVKWEQWTRGGPYGDDVDCEDKAMAFDTLEMAENFVEALVDGVYRGLGDMKVRRDEVKIIAK